MLRKSFFLLLIVFLLFFSCSAKKEDKQKRDNKITQQESEKIFFNQTIVLKGIVEIGVTNDFDYVKREVRYYRLKLFSPITVLGDTNDELSADSFTNVRYIQLSHFSSKYYNNFTNKAVVVKGRLYERFAGRHQILPVLIAVESIEILTNKMISNTNNEFLK